MVKKKKTRFKNSDDMADIALVEPVIKITLVAVKSFLYSTRLVV